MIHSWPAAVLHRMIMRGVLFFVVLLVGTCMIWIEIIELSNQFKHAVYCLSPILKHMIQYYFLFNILTKSH